MVRKIFVYGSLMEGLFNYEKYLKGKVISRKCARTKGELYHLTSFGYPAMIKGNDYVYGELIEVIDFEETVKNLDGLEHFYGEGFKENEYNRTVIKVEVLKEGTHEFVYAYAYLYNAVDIKKLKQDNSYVKDGNWKKYLSKNHIETLALALA